MTRKPKATAVASAVIFVVCAAASADDITRDTIGTWLADMSRVDLPPAGTVIGIAELDMLRPLIPPGYFEEFQFPGVSIEIQETAHYPGHESYRQATARFRGQATIGADGRLENYHAGRPFAADQIDAATPEIAGYMLAWDQYHRWQYYGYQVDELFMNYVTAAAADTRVQRAEGMEGGGHVQRSLGQTYHRVYLSKLAMLPGQDFRVNAPDSGTRFFKDYIEFLEPFNVKGTRFVIERMLDPHEDDQVNSYLPTERRVRRLSAQERADSFMGSDVTFDDFDGFSGRVLDYQWTYLGKKRVLDVVDSKYPALRFFGPMSRVPNDQWQMRNCYVVESHSVWDGHPYRSRVILIDEETFDVAVTLVFDRDNKLWKVLDPIYQAAEPPDAPGASIETSVSSWRGQVNIDRTADKATIVRAKSATRHPTVTASQIKRMFSVSSLTSGQ